LASLSGEGEIFLGLVTSEKEALIESYLDNEDSLAYETGGGGSLVI